MGQEQKETLSKAHSHEALRMKGHAVPLFGYHMLRDIVLAEITGEHQSSVLYWAGKDLAHQFSISTYEECIHLFSELGWGHLDVKQSSAKEKTFILESPFFPIRNMDKNQSTFALECGFLTECLALVEKKETQGYYEVVSKGQEYYVQFFIHLEERKEPISS